eukprot:Polyplicarium_translucidae@DN1013_c0_g1_i1.p1
MEVNKLDKALERLNGASRSMILFHAPWHPPAQQIRAMLDPLGKDHPGVAILAADAEVVGPEFVKYFRVVKIPTAVLFVGGEEVFRIAGADPPLLVQKLKKLAAEGMEPVPGGLSLCASKAAAALRIEEELQERLKRLTTAADVMLFMKGTKAQPFCKFSRAFVDMFTNLEAEYSCFNILQDEEVRQGMKDFSQWPTFPQLYVKGEFIGGLDICKAMVEDGSMQQLLEKAGALPKQATATSSDTARL